MPQRPLQSAGTLIRLSLFASLAVGGSARADHPCASVADATARLACYDQAFGKPTAAKAAHSGPVAASPAAPTGATATAAAAAAAAPSVAPEVKAREEFGLSETEKRAKAGKTAAPEAADSITSKVASVGHRPTGEMIVTLEDGQVWVETETGSGARIKPGDSVTIHRAALGSYMLVTSSHVGTRVRRVK